METTALLCKLLAGLKGPVLSAIRSQAYSRPEVVRLLEPLGLRTLTKSFDSIYAHALIRATAAGSRPEVLALFADSDTLQHFKKFWRDGDELELSASLERSIRQTAKGDAFQSVGADAELERRRLVEAFTSVAHDARDPTEQETARLIKALAHARLGDAARARRRPPLRLPPPIRVGELLGRRSEREALRAALLRGEDAAVVGPPGFGKTALATAAIADIVGRDGARLADSPFPDGIVFIDRA